jgi:hypothetical protein
MEAGGSLLYSQEAANGPNSEPDQSSLHHQPYFSWTHSNIITSTSVYEKKFSRFSDQNFVRISRLSRASCTSRPSQRTKYTADTKLEKYIDII